jgi:F420-dependent oxidoreductase-like protein
MTIMTNPTIAPFTRIGLQIPNFTYPGVGDADLFETVATVAQTAEAAGADSIFVMDHFFQLAMLGTPDHNMFESYTLLSALAARTSTVRLGALVTGVTYRNPAVLAKVVTTLDVVSRGRALLGIGAAWFELEHKALGVPFPPLRERFERLEDAIRICRAMFTQDQSSVTGKHFSIDGAWNHPAPVQPGGPRIMLGGSGEKVTFRLAARYADELNVIAPIPELPRKIAALHGHLDDLGRPRDAVRTSTLITLVIGDDDAAVDEQLVELLTLGGVTDAGQAVKDPDRRADLSRRLIAGTPDSAAEDLRKLVGLGFDGVIVNLPVGGHDPAYTDRAMRVVRSAVDA